MREGKHVSQGGAGASVAVVVLARRYTCNLIQRINESLAKVDGLGMQCAHCALSSTAPPTLGHLVGRTWAASTLSVGGGCVRKGCHEN